MEKLGRIGGIGAIIGVIADLIAIIAFLGGFLKPPPSGDQDMTTIHFVAAASLIALAYTWLSLSWYFMQKDLDRRRNTPPRNLDTPSNSFVDSVLKRSAGAGAALLPISFFLVPYCLWVLYADFPSEISYSYFESYAMSVPFATLLVLLGIYLFTIVVNYLLLPSLFSDVLDKSSE